MTRRKRRNQRPTFKAQVASVALKGDKTLAEPAQQFDIPPPPDCRREVSFPRFFVFQPVGIMPPISVHAGR